MFLTAEKVYSREDQDNSDTLEKRITLNRPAYHCDGCIATPITPLQPFSQLRLRSAGDEQDEPLEKRVVPPSAIALGFKSNGPSKVPFIAPVPVTARDFADSGTLNLRAFPAGPFGGMGGPPAGGPSQGGFPGGRPNFPRDDLETRAPPFGGMGGGRPGRQGGFPGGHPNFPRDDLEARAPRFGGMGGGRPNFPRDNSDIEARAPPFAGMGGGRPGPQGGFAGGRPSFSARDDNQESGALQIPPPMSGSPIKSLNAAKSPHLTNSLIPTKRSFGPMGLGPVHFGGPPSRPMARSFPFAPGAGGFGPGGEFPHPGAGAGPGGPPTNGAGPDLDARSLADLD
ncbi:hypothetical protein K474DRAFT_1097875 [Panus rudis PR-1116 ss-1]|nr:hypothetical protein K474DRAFT_1097875 [Panus rudis PR-1116 ss-1]